MSILRKTGTKQDRGALAFTARQAETQLPDIQNLLPMVGEGKVDQPELALTRWSGSKLKRSISTEKNFVVIGSLTGKKLIGL